jgi:hypothetical protein
MSMDTCELSRVIDHLMEVNKRLLGWMQSPSGKDSSQLEELLQQRQEVSERLSALVETMQDLQLGDLSSEIQSRLFDVLRQDRELLVYVELENEKALGRYHRLRVMSQ